MIGTSLVSSLESDLFNITLAAEQAVESANLRRYNDAVEHVIFFATPHWQEHLHEVCHNIIKSTHCMQVWGGISHAVYRDGVLANEHPAIAVAVIGRNPDETYHANLDLLMGHNDDELASVQEFSRDGNRLGLLSFGPNQTRHGRVQSGRVATDGASLHQIPVRGTTLFESVGLESLGDWGYVTGTTGLSLDTVNQQAALGFLRSPDENTKPVGLRLGVERQGQVQWIPIVSIHSDGSATLAAPVGPGEKVCLAARTAHKAEQELRAWTPPSLDSRKNKHHLGILFGGLDRSPLCHADDSELQFLNQQWQAIPMIGAIGQAVWIRHPDIQTLTGPLNHRLAMALIER